MSLLKRIFRLTLLPPLHKYVEKTKWPHSKKQLKRDRKSLYIISQTYNRLRNYTPLKLEKISLTNIKLHKYYMSDELKENQRYILYLHGGGFCINTPETYKPIFYKLCKYTDCIIFAPKYRLSPETCYPHSLNHCIESYKYLVDVLKLDPSRIIFAGDSAGGNISVAMCYKIAMEGVIGQPAGILNFSPWLDLSMKGPSYQFNIGKDKLLPLESIKRAIWLYVKGNFNYNQFDDSTQNKFKEVCLEKGMPYVYGNQSEQYQKKLQSPLISPVYMRPGMWMNNFPRMYIHCAAEEGCNPEEDENFRATVCVWRDEIHAFPVFGKLEYPNAKDCLKDAASWIIKLLPY